MQELIDKQVALSEIDATIEGSLQRPEDVYIDKGLMMARTIIKNLHSIKAEPVRNGRWIETTYHPVGDNMYCDCNCSNCNFEITREKGRYPKFCENCGADMQEEQED